MFELNDIVCFRENHKWIGCIGFVNEIKPITDSNGKSVSADTSIGTGYKVTINGSTKATYTILIYGDISGDGKIGSLDLLKLQRHILKASTLSDIYLESADANKDGKLLSLDLLVIQKHVLKAEIIKQ